MAEHASKNRDNDSQDEHLRTLFWMTEAISIGFITLTLGLVGALLLVGTANVVGHIFGLVLLAAAGVCVWGTFNDLVSEFNRHAKNGVIKD